MDSSLRLLPLPGELEYLASRGDSTSPTDLEIHARGRLETPELSGIALQRLSDLVRTEVRHGEFTVAHPTWLQNRAIPRLIVTLRYNSQDAFGTARALQRLDLAARRAGAMHRHLLRDDADKTWPTPLRTPQGGLHILDARVGSVDVLMTVWGALATIAGSAPISVASLFALAWDIGRGSVHVTKRWRGAAMARAQQDPMEHERLESAEGWGIKHTKALAPVLAKAIENDQGFEFSLSDGSQQIKITVLPKA